MTSTQVKHPVLCLLIVGGVVQLAAIVSPGWLIEDNIWTFKRSIGIWYMIKCKDDDCQITSLVGKGYRIETEWSIFHPVLLQIESTIAFVCTLAVIFLKRCFLKYRQQTQVWGRLIQFTLALISGTLSIHMAKRYGEESLVYSFYTYYTSFYGDYSRKFSPCVALIGLAGVFLCTASFLMLGNLLIYVSALQQTLPTITGSDVTSPGIKSPTTRQKCDPSPYCLIAGFVFVIGLFVGGGALFYSFKDEETPEPF